MSTVYPAVKAKRYIDRFDSAGRKRVPMFSGLIAYFPDALAAVAEHSFKGNEKHNPGEPLHHARGKSMDHTDCIIRHVAAGPEGVDGDSLEAVALAWRALAYAQEVLERKYALTIPEGATDVRAFIATHSLVGPNGEQAPKEAPKKVPLGSAASFKKTEPVKPDHVPEGDQFGGFKAPRDKTDEHDFKSADFKRTCDALAETKADFAPSVNTMTGRTETFKGGGQG
jgi:hypothetical protein